MTYDFLHAIWIVYEHAQTDNILILYQRQRGNVLRIDYCDAGPFRGALF